MTLTLSDILIHWEELPKHARWILYRGKEEEDKWRRRRGENMSGEKEGRTRRG